MSRSSPPAKSPLSRRNAAGCGTSFSKSTVSALCARLDPLVTAWNERPLGEQAFPFVLADALVVKVREQERVRSLAALIAIGINAAGYREILGIQLGDSESENSWAGFFTWLKRRGLSGVDLVVSDAHTGLVAAVQRHFQGCTWQRCQTHLAGDVHALRSVRPPHRPGPSAAVGANVRQPGTQSAGDAGDGL